MHDSMDLSSGSSSFKCAKLKDTVESHYTALVQIFLYFVHRITSLCKKLIYNYDCRALRFLKLILLHMLQVYCMIMATLEG